MGVDWVSELSICLRFWFFSSLSLRSSFWQKLQKWMIWLIRSSVLVELMSNEVLE